MIYFVLFCTLIQIGCTRSTFVDDDEDQNPIENSLANNYVSLNDRLNEKIPFEDYYYNNKKQFNPGDVQLTKRIIMLPRVGRRSIRST